MTQYKQSILIQPLTFQQASNGRNREVSRLYLSIIQAVTTINHRVKNKRELHSSLKGATLGDPGGEEEDVVKWIKRSKKKEKLLAQKRQEELAKMDEGFLAEYTERK